MTYSCKMHIRIWQPNNPNWKTIVVNVPNRPVVGPKDKYLLVPNANIKPNEDGDFTNKNYTDQELDSIHTFAIARLTINLWEAALNKQIVWGQINQRPYKELQLFPHCDLIDAFCRHDQHALVFGISEFNFQPVCRSLDFVAHETAHAIMESIRPGIHNTGDEYTNGVLEALADLSAIFLKAQIPSIIEQAANSTNNKLYKKNIISEFGLGLGKRHNTGIRSALKKSIIRNDRYKKSTLLTYLVYVRFLSCWELFYTTSHWTQKLQSLISNTFSPILTMENATPKRYFDLIESD